MDPISVDAGVGTGELSLTSSTTSITPEITSTSNFVYEHVYSNTASPVRGAVEHFDAMTSPVSDQQWNENGINAAQQAAAVVVTPLAPPTSAQLAATTYSSHRQSEQHLKVVQDESVPIAAVEVITSAPPAAVATPTVVVTPVVQTATTAASIVASSKDAHIPLPQSMLMPDDENDITATLSRALATCVPSPTYTASSPVSPTRNTNDRTSSMTDCFSPPSTSTPSRFGTMSFGSPSSSPTRYTPKKSIMIPIASPEVLKQRQSRAPSMAPQSLFGTMMTPTAAANGSSINSTLLPPSGSTPISSPSNTSSNIRHTLQFGSGTMNLPIQATINGSPVSNHRMTMNGSNGIGSGNGRMSTIKTVQIGNGNNGAGGSNSANNNGHMIYSTLSSPLPPAANKSFSLPSPTSISSTISSTLLASLPITFDTSNLISDLDSLLEAQNGFAIRAHFARIYNAYEAERQFNIKLQAIQKVLSQEVKETKRAKETIQEECAEEIEKEKKEKEEAKLQVIESEFVLAEEREAKEEVEKKLYDVEKTVEEVKKLIEEKEMKLSDITHQLSEAQHLSSTYQSEVFEKEKQHRIAIEQVMHDASVMQQEILGEEKKRCEEVIGKTKEEKEESMNKLKSEMSAQIEQLQQKLEEEKQAKGNVESTVNDLQDKLASTVAMLSSTTAELTQAKAEITRLTSEFDASQQKISELLHSRQDHLTASEIERNEQVVKAKEVQEELQEKIVQLEAALQGAEASLVTVREESAQQIEAIRQQNEVAVQNLHHENELSMQSLREENDRTVQTMRQEKELAVQSIQEENDRTVQSLRDENDRAVQMIRQENEEAIQAIHEENNQAIKKIRQENEDAVQVIQNEKNTLEAQLSEAMREKSDSDEARQQAAVTISELTDKVNSNVAALSLTLTEDLTHATAEVTRLTTSLTTSHAKIAHLEHQLQEVQQATMELNQVANEATEEMKKEVEELMEKVKLKEAELGEVRDQLTTSHNSSLQQHALTLEKLHTEKQQLEDCLKQVQHEADHQSEESEKMIRELRQEKNDLETELKNTRSAYEQSNERVTGVEKELNELKELRAMEQARVAVSARQSMVGGGMGAAVVAASPARQFSFAPKTSPVKAAVPVAVPTTISASFRAKLKRLASGSLSKASKSAHTSAHDVRTAFATFAGDMRETSKLIVDAIQAYEERTGGNTTGVNSQGQTLYQRYQHEKKLRMKLHEQLLDLQGNIRVFTRVRPIMANTAINASGGAYNSSNLLSVPNECGRHVQEMEQDATRWIDEYTLGHSGKIYEFDKVLHQQSTQEEVFKSVEPYVQSVIDGYNVCMLAYGQTGSGKSFTMEGTPSDPGLVTRSLTRLFALLEEQSSSSRSIVRMSSVEIYNERVQDLLQEPLTAKQRAAASLQNGEQVKLEIHQTPEGQIYIPGLTEKQVDNVEEVQYYIDRFIKPNRSTAATSMNEHSSRSHSLLFLNVETTQIGEGEDAGASAYPVDGITTRGRLILIDLAGSERIKHSEAVGICLKEATCINKSLSALGDVIAALKTKAAHIPWRNSKLTYLLSDAMSGQSKVLMFAQISPSISDTNESACTLQFAQRVRAVQLGAATVKTKNVASTGSKSSSASSSSSSAQSTQLLLTKLLRAESLLLSKDTELENRLSELTQLRSDLNSERSAHQSRMTMIQANTDGKVRQLEQELNELRIQAREAAVTVAKLEAELAAANSAAEFTSSTVQAQVTSMDEDEGNNQAESQETEVTQTLNFDDIGIIDLNDKENTSVLSNILSHVNNTNSTGVVPVKRLSGSKRKEEQQQVQQSNEQQQADDQPQPQQLQKKAKLSTNSLTKSLSSTISTTTAPPSNLPVLFANPRSKSTSFKSLSSSSVVNASTATAPATTAGSSTALAGVRSRMSGSSVNNSTERMIKAASETTTAKSSRPTPNAAAAAAAPSSGFGTPAPVSRKVSITAAWNQEHPSPMEGDSALLSPPSFDGTTDFITGGEQRKSVRFGSTECKFISPSPIHHQALTTPANMEQLRVKRSSSSSSSGLFGGASTVVAKSTSVGSMLGGAKRQPVKGNGVTSSAPTWNKF